MILYVNGSVRHPVFDCNTGKYYGRITDIVLDDGFKEVLGYVCRTRIFRPRWAFEPSAVRLVNEELMLIDRKGKKWLPLNGAIREAWRRSKNAHRIKVVEGERKVGEVADFAFGGETGRVVGLLVSRGLLGKLVFIPQSDVEMAGRDCIAVKEGAVTGRVDAGEGRLFDGLLKSAAKSIGIGVAKARAAAMERAATSLVGKASPAEIVSEDGRVLAAEGEALTPELIAKLQEEDKLPEASLLMMGKGFGAALAKAHKRLKSN